MSRPETRWHQDENEDEVPNYFNIESQSESSKEIIASALKSAAKSAAAGKGNKSGGAGGKKSRRKSAAGSSTSKPQQEEKPLTPREEKEADNGLSPEEAARQVSLERELTNRYLSGELTFQVFFFENFAVSLELLRCQKFSRLFVGWSVVLPGA